MPTVLVVDDEGDIRASLMSFRNQKAIIEGNDPILLAYDILDIRRQPGRAHPAQQDVHQRLRHRESASAATPAVAVPTRATHLEGRARAMSLGASPSQFDLFRRYGSARRKHVRGDFVRIRSQSLRSPWCHRRSETRELRGALSRASESLARLRCLRPRRP